MIRNEAARERFAWSSHGPQLLPWLPTAVGFALVVLCYPVVGPLSLLFLLLSLATLVIGATRNTIGKKVNELALAHDSGRAESAESKIVSGTIEAPGLAILTESELTLIPIVGEEVRVGLEEIESMEQVSWFNGTKLWWKTGFVLHVPGHRRLAFAVAESTGRAWQQRLVRRPSLVAV